MKLKKKYCVFPPSRERICNAWGDLYLKIVLGDQFPIARPLSPFKTLKYNG